MATSSKYHLTCTTIKAALLLAAFTEMRFYGPVTAAVLRTNPER